MSYISFNTMTNADDDSPVCQIAAVGHQVVVRKTKSMSDFVLPQVSVAGIGSLHEYPIPSNKAGIGQIPILCFWY